MEYPGLTKYEITRIIGGRALQLALGAFPLLPPRPNESPYELAEREFRAGVLPIIIRRRFPDGTYEDISLQKLREVEVLKASTA
ncbi:MAG: DNA-directed RNA polymerase subunit K [Aigarchaeota archaeon]|nr:DNA-directed RNA polymerase subunit K [Aigarchaeota archaeon]MDW8092621.1 DNA-directed RNA polymerase subunit K [Nitrososphaerota archaeon]